MTNAEGEQGADHALVIRVSSSHLGGAVASRREQRGLAQPTRRGLLTSLVCLIAAPTIVRAANLMPVKAPRSLTQVELINEAIRQTGAFGDAMIYIEYDLVYQKVVRSLLIPEQYLALQ